MASLEQEVPHGRAEPTIALMGAYGDIIELCSLMNSPTAKASTGQHWQQGSAMLRTKHTIFSKKLRAGIVRIVRFP